MKEILLKNNIFYVLLGLLLGVRISIFGEIYIGEFLSLILIIPLVLLRKIHKDEVFVIIPCFIWFLLQFVSDIYNANRFDFMIKGVLAPIVFMATIITHFYFFRNNIKIVIPYLIGLYLIKIIFILLFPTEYHQINSWKFGLGVSVLFIALLLLSNIKKDIFIFIFILIFMLISFMNDSRSIAFFPLLGFLIYLYTKNISTLKFFSKNTLVKIIFPAVFLAIFINSTANFIFSQNIINGFLPEEVEQKFRTQATSDIGLLFAGRTEILVSVKAFMDSPIIGHGSWAQDENGKYRSEYNYLRYLSGVTEIIKSSDKTLIPTHSFLMGAAVWYGVGGLFVWLFFINILLKKYFRYINKLPIYFHVGIFLLIWDILFSPFGADARWYTAIFISAFYAWVYNIQYTQNMNIRKE